MSREVHVRFSEGLGEIPPGYSTRHSRPVRRDRRLGNLVDPHRPQKHNGLMQRDEEEDHWQDRGDLGPGPVDGGSGHLDDPELVQRLRDSDGDALRALMGRYDRLVRYAVFRLCRTECVRDPTFLDSRASETWTGFVRSIQRTDCEPPQNLKTYLIQIAKNKCTDALRRTEGAAPAQTSDRADDGSVVEAPSPGSLELLIQAEELLALRECLEKLSPTDKRLCDEMEHLVAGRWKLAAEALGMPESTLRSRWAGIIGKLKACLEKKKQKLSARRFGPSDS